MLAALAWVWIAAGWLASAGAPAGMLAWGAAALLALSGLGLDGAWRWAIAHLRLAAMSVPAAVRWACACAAPASNEAAMVPDASCVAAAVRWADDPSEDNRRAAMAAAAATDYSTPGAWAAAAAGLAGGSLASPDVPVVPPPDHLTAHAVAGAVALAAASDPEHLAEREIAFLQAALDLADGRGPVPNGSGA